MPDKLDFDRLIQEAKRLGRHRTAKKAMEAALCEYITKRKQLEIINFFGKIDYDASYDYKAARNRKLIPKSSGADPSPSRNRKRRRK